MSVRTPAQLRLRLLSCRFFRYALILAVVALLFGTFLDQIKAGVSQTAQLPDFGIMVEGHELVMPPFSQITATDSGDTITITAGDGLLRCFTWTDDATGCLKLSLAHEDWGLGAYNPGVATNGLFMNWTWRNQAGIYRAVAREAQQHLTSLDEFPVWLNRYTSGGVHGNYLYAYRDDGLVVVWGKNVAHNGGTLDVDVWQIYIGGQKPTKLPGSRNDEIKVRMVDELPKDTVTRTFLLF